MSTTQEPSYSTCLKPESTLASPLNRCSKCKFALYCSRTCQAADWKDGHKQFCNANKESHEEDLKVLEKEFGSKAIPTKDDGLDALRATLESKFGVGSSTVSKSSYA